MKNSTFSLLRHFGKYYRSRVFILVVDILCAIICAGCDLYTPIVARSLTSKASVGVNGLTFQGIFGLAMLFMILRVVDICANYFMRRDARIAGAEMETAMRYDLFTQLMRQGCAFYDKERTGSLISRISNDLSQMGEFAFRMPEEIALVCITILGTFSVMLWMNFRLALVVFAIFPVTLAITYFFMKKIRQTYREQHELIGKINARAQDSLQGIRVVKSFVGEPHEISRFENNLGEFLTSKKKLYTATSTYKTIIKVSYGLLSLSVIAVGGWLVSIGKMTIADLIAFIMYSNYLINAVQRIVEFSDQIQNSITGFERYTEIINSVPEITDAENAIDLPEGDGTIEFRNVTFSYSEKGRTILDHLSLKIPAGQNIAIVGPSGSGKTTMCSLISRFYDTVEGAVLVNGIDVRELKQQSLRAHVGIVQQDVYLFDDSIAANISYANPSATREEIIQAARMAGAEEFINELPDGYDTWVGERGVQLSGGQKQRIAIARVYLQNPSILILDEATSALDNMSERIVQDALSKLAKGRTTITVAHRLSTIKNADRIIVFAEGKIAEDGTHDELIKNNGIYAELCNSARM